MSDSREVILGRIRQALETAYLPDAHPTLPPESPFRRGASPGEQQLRPAELIDQFTQSLESVGGEVVRAADEVTARERLMEQIRHSEVGEVLAWPDEELPSPINALLAAEGFTATFVRLDGDPDLRRRQMDLLDRPLIGVTGAMAGLADTGSLALLSGAQRPMTTSLLPLIHLALLRERDIVPDMATFLTRHQAEGLTIAARNLVFITGPSRTADIEMILTRGVHGPKRLVVLLLAEETQAT